MEKYDVIVIGSGPGGYVSAIRNAQLGKKTAIIEKYPSLGGTCLNVGCIPSKALLDSSEKFYEAQNHFRRHGINIENLSVDWKIMLQRKDKILKKLSVGINHLMKKNNIDVYVGTAKFVDRKVIEIQQTNEIQKITAENIIIATGSKPSSLPNINIDKNNIMSSTEALSLKEIPKSLVVIGGGVIGLEMGSIFKRLGSEVTVVEYCDTILPNMDKDVCKNSLKIFKKQGLNFLLQHQVTAVEKKNNQVIVKVKDNEQKNIEITAEKCLVAVGRKPYIENLDLQTAGIKINEKNFIEVDAELQTSVSGIYAIGDVIGGLMLAHKAEDEGIFVAEKIAGQKPHLNYFTIPQVVYTWPEIASTGFTEQEVQEKNINYKTASFPFQAIGRAQASENIDGMVKMIADSTTDELLGIHIIGARAADLIAECVVALEYKASAEDIARIVHPHPTFSEAIREAALSTTEKRAIHL